MSSIKNSIANDITTYRARVNNLDLLWRLVSNSGFKANPELRDAMSSNPEPKIDTGAACLGMMLRFFSLPADIDGIIHRHRPSGGKLETVDLLKAAKSLDLKAKLIEPSIKRLDKTPLPAIAIHKDGHFFILAKIAEGKVLIQDPLEGRPRSLAEEEFVSSWNGELILLTHRSGLAGEKRRFDITWFIPSIVKYRHLLSEVLVASLFLQLFALVSPLFSQVVIDKVLVHRGLSTLDVLVIGLLTVSLFETILGILRTYIFTHTTNRIDVELGAKLFQHMLDLPLPYFAVRKAGQTVARVRELENIRNFLTGQALTLVIDLLFAVIFIAVMYYYSATLTIIVILAVPFYVILSFIATPVLHSRLEEKFKRGAENQAFLVEAVGGIETIKSLAVEPRMQQDWEKQLAAYVQASFKVGQASNIAGQTAQFLNKLVTGILLWVGAKMVIDNQLSVGELIAFNMLAGRFNGPVLRLAQLWQDFQQIRISLERLGDLLNTPTEPAAGGSRTALPPLRGHIKMEDIRFRYRPDSNPTIDNLFLEVNAGEIIGIVGPSGSGKSTLTKLLQRLYLPERGKILIDGIDIAMADPAWLRRQIGVVLQDNHLFNRSVRENIALANPSLSLEKVIEAAKQAGAHDFILELPEGYDTILAEKGASLSGGQRQRIAIARALASNPRILIFDEATSALDYESERVIQSNMRSICQGRTVLIIAHRLMAVRQADRIITIEKGNIVEDGNHEQLLNKGGRYASLFRMQSEVV